MSKLTKIEHEGEIVPPDFEAGKGPLTGQMSSRFLVEEIRSQGRIFRLNQPAQIDVTNSADGWCYESKPLAILAFGRSKQEAFDSFTEDFSVLWDAIAQAPDESLTGDAVAVKRAFRQLVGTVAAE